MSLNFMLRRASSSFPRAAGSPRFFRGAISPVLNVEDYTLSGKSLFQLPQPHNFSTAAASTAKKSSSDDNLLRIIDFEIKHVEDNEDHDCLEIPDKFPFAIQDNPGERTILLTRNYENEVIKVLVDMPNPEFDDDDGDDDDNKGNVQSSIPLVVSVSKKDGFCLEFGITAFPNEISIDNLSIKNPDTSEDQIAYEGPEFSDLKKKMQNALIKYLEIREIKPSVTNIVLEYMITKDHKEYLMWLKNLKSLMN